MNTSNFYNDVTGEEFGLVHVIYDYSDEKIYRIPEDRLCELESFAAGNNEKSLLIDVATKIHYSMPVQKLREIADEVVEKSRETITSLQDKIKNLNFNKTWLGKKVEKLQQIAPDLAKLLRESLLKILHVTKTIGGKIVHWGAKFIQFVLEVLANNPNVGIGILVVAVLSFAISHVPIVGQALAGLVLPFACIYFIGLPVVQSILQETSFKRKMADFTRVDFN